MISPVLKAIPNFCSSQIKDGNKRNIKARQNAKWWICDFL